MKTIQQAGLSLIELMIAMALGIFLILGVTQIYIDNKKSYSFQQSQSENQEGSRYSLLFLQQELAKAGYRRRPDESIENAFPAAVISGCTFSAGQTVKRDSATAICIRYQPRDHRERDCLGTIVDSTLTTPYTKTNSVVAQKIHFDGANQEITCTRGNSSGAIVNGIADLRFEYGVGSAVAPQTVSSFIKSAASSNQPVLAVRYTSLFRSTSSRLRESTSVDTALANWQALTGATTAELAAMKQDDNGNLYQVTQNTVMLRNRMP
ncbi:PilW family protein [Pseudomonas leptonychotis]|uniref:PilW family protein n=1 Tax=Pseudomonas leptonychotis TaxID=2448482 RepID=UPI003867068D